jgi:hypothetical protein
MDPTDSERLYAVMWDHRREPDVRTYGGVGSGLFRTDDGGDTWTRLQNVETFTPGNANGPADESGLASDETLGRIGDGVIRAQARSQRGPETNHHEQRVVDPHGEREHQGEVHRPDRDAGELCADPERAGGGPRIARSSGIPAAASEPKATASTANVTGQDSTSERSIAALFSSLNSDHRPAEPVSDTSIPGPATASSRSRRRPAARTISVVPAAAPPRTTATRRSARSTRRPRATAPLRPRGRAAAGPSRGLPSRGKLAARCRASTS